MGSKVKAKPGNKTIIRHGSQTEQEWFLRMCATLRDKEMKRSPIISVTDLKGDEIQLPAMKPVMQSTMTNPATQTMPSETAPVLITPAIQTEKTGEKKDGDSTSVQ